MIHYQTTEAFQLGMTLSSLVQRAQANSKTKSKGPIPQLGSGQRDLLGMSEYAVINIDGATDSHGRPNQLAAFGLNQCAGVILASTDKSASAKAAVYHAPSGGITTSMFGVLLEAIGNPPVISLLIAYATPKTWDENYTAAVKTIENYGVSTDRVVCIGKWFSNMFGITSLGHVGC